MRLTGGCSCLYPDLRKHMPGYAGRVLCLPCADARSSRCVRRVLTAALADAEPGTACRYAASKFADMYETRAGEQGFAVQCAQAENREKKWDTLVHAGVLFPPEYEPHGVRMLYEGKPVELSAEQVRAAWRARDSSTSPPPFVCHAASTAGKSQTRPNCLLFVRLSCNCSWLNRKSSLNVVNDWQHCVTCCFTIPRRNWRR